VDVDVGNRRTAIEYDAQQISADVVRGQLEQIGFSPEEPPPEPRVVEARRAAPERAAPAEETRPAWYWLLAIGVALLALAGYAGYVLYPRFGLPAVSGAALLLLATGAGIASFFSPCSFPLLVTLLARETGVEARARAAQQPVGRALTFAGSLSLGAAVFLLLAGVAIALGGGALFAGVTFTSPVGRIIRTLVGGLLIALGLIQLGVIPITLHAIEDAARPLMRSQARYRRRNPVVGFGILGFGYLLAGFG
jgi:cytochrome c biogenesis protein CcdA